jgi:hypothetical protein
MAETYSVFVKFKHRRLTLRRKIPNLSAAIQFADDIRAVRFHDPESVFVVLDRTGEIVHGAGAVPRTSGSADAARAPVRLAWREQRDSLLAAERCLAQTIACTRDALRGAADGRLCDALEKLDAAQADLAATRQRMESLDTADDRGEARPLDDESEAQAG